MEVKMVAARIQNGYKPGGGIRANEIKGFLNIWCNQRRLKPEYDFIEAGFHWNSPLFHPNFTRKSFLTREHQWKPIKSGASLPRVPLFVSWKSKASIILPIAKHGRSERPRRTQHGTLLTNLSNSDIVTKMIFQIKLWPLSITKGKSSERVRGYQTQNHLDVFRPNGNRFCPMKWLLPRDSGHQTTAERDSGPFQKLHLLFLCLACAKISRIFCSIFESKKSMFCNYEKISCEILNTAIGPDHAKIAIAELKLTLRKYGKGIIGK